MFIAMTLADLEEKREYDMRRIGNQQLLLIAVLLSIGCSSAQVRSLVLGTPQPPDEGLRTKLLEVGNAMGWSLDYEDRTEGLFMWRFEAVGFGGFGSDLVGYTCEGRFLWYVKHVGNELWLDDPVIMKPGCPMPPQQQQSEMRRLQEEFKQRLFTLTGPVTLRGPTPATHSAQIEGEAFARSLRQ
jgi:hypothetical protein